MGILGPSSCRPASLEHIQGGVLEYQVESVVSLPDGLGLLVSRVIVTQRNAAARVGYLSRTKSHSLVLFFSPPQSDRPPHQACNEFESMSQCGFRLWIRLEPGPNEKAWDYGEEEDDDQPSCGQLQRDSW